MLPLLLLAVGCVSHILPGTSEQKDAPALRITTIRNGGRFCRMMAEFSELDRQPNWRYLGRDDAFHYAQDFCGTCVIRARIEEVDANELAAAMRQRDDDYAAMLRNPPALVRQGNMNPEDQSAFDAWLSQAHLVNEFQVAAQTGAK